MQRLTSTNSSPAIAAAVVQKLGRWRVIVVLVAGAVALLELRGWDLLANAFERRLYKERRRQNQFHRPLVCYLATVHGNSNETGWTRQHHRESGRVRISTASKSALHRRKHLKDSGDYEKLRRHPASREGDDKCEPMQWWQGTSFPTCNGMHELDLTDVGGSDERPKFVHINNGVYNDVFNVTDVDGKVYILKRLQSHKDYSDRNMERVRLDALVMERLTKSPNIMDVYSYCGFAEIIPYGGGGNFGEYYSKLKKREGGIPGKTKLALASTIATSLADLHDIDGDGRAAVSHGDLCSVQFINMGGVFKLADFNQGRFIMWNKEEGRPCTYVKKRANSKYRAPEEYMHEPIGAKTDVWSLGTMIQKILTGSSAWSGVDSPKARRRIVRGEFPPIDDAYRNSDDPIDVILRKAMDLCYVYDPSKRSTSAEVAAFLKEEAEKIGVGLLDRFT